MNRSRISGALCCAVLALAVGACGGSDDADDAADTTTTEAEETTTTAADEATTTTAEGSDEGTNEERLATLLLSLDEFNAANDGSFEDVGWERSTEGLPCGDDPDVTTPPDVITGSDYISGSLQLEFQEEIRVYQATDDQAAAYAAAIAGFTCDTAAGEVVPEGLTIAPPESVTDVVGGDDAQVIAFSGADFEGAAFIVSYSDTIVVFNFVGPADADTSALASPADLVAAGMQKIIDTIG